MPKKTLNSASSMVATGWVGLWAVMVTTATLTAHAATGAPVRPPASAPSATDTAATRATVAAIQRDLAQMRRVRFTTRRPGNDAAVEGQAWALAGAVQKIQTTEPDDSGDVVSEWYFSGSQPVFLLEAVRGFVDGRGAPRQVTVTEERFYFRDGRAFKWLSGMGDDKTDHPTNGTAFAQATGPRLVTAAALLTAAQRALAAQPAGATGPATASSTASGAGAQACAPGERVVFACRTGQQRVAVCASADAGPRSGHLQYRFGPADPATAPDLQLPAARVPPPQAATGRTVPFAGGGGSWLRFRSGPYAYVVYSGIGQWGPKGQVLEKQGVVVERDGRPVAHRPCTQTPVDGMGPEDFERLGIRAAETEDFLFPD